MVPAPRKCALCPWPIYATERSDKEFCSDACRSLHWQRKNRVPISAYTVEDFAEVLAVLARNEVRLGRKAQLLGYSLRALPKGKAARLGEVSFPDPNRKTKRFPDESGVAPCPSGALLSLRSVRAAPRPVRRNLYRDAALG